MMKNKIRTPQGSIKYAIGWILVFAVRLLPWRPPNMEPVMTALMPFGKKYGMLGSFLFAFLSIALFDMATSGIGSWTYITAVTYGLVGIMSARYFRNRTPSALNFVIFSIIGTLIYDAITGLGMGPLLWGQSFAEAFIGQIPFTLWHLGSNTFLAMTISPLIWRWVVQNQKLELSTLTRRPSTSFNNA